MKATWKTSQPIQLGKRKTNNYNVLQLQWAELLVLVRWCFLKFSSDMPGYGKS